MSAKNLFLSIYRQRLQLEVLRHESVIKYRIHICFRLKHNVRIKENEKQICKRISEKREIAVIRVASFAYGPVPFTLDTILHRMLHPHLLKVGMRMAS